MGWFSADSDQAQAYDQYQSMPHEAKISHELIAAAASYEAAKAYENHVAENGPPPSHEKAKEILAGLAGAFIDRDVETKGLDFIDREEAKRDATRQLHEVSAQDY
ncbi:phosphoglycerate mutase family protein [Aspergillus udagawae]|uniref:Phosphoglycerate mutase family protein n=1 Tax=Aspergillus udagawae TaxID=91492 RepID=A0ABQ1B665_9EURO|nr:phosphoglycerate mutase family protein [Aspergillus udagawae]